MKPPPLISVCFFGCRAASTGGIDDDIRGMFDRGFTGHLRQSFGLLFSVNQLQMPLPLGNDCAKHLDEFGLIMMSSEAACPDQARKKTQYFYVMIDGVEILRNTKYFLGSYEVEIDDAGNERKLHYISAGDGVFAIVEKVNQADAQIHYIHKNYLGSYDAITNHLGVVEERLSFDPWGRRRNPSTGIVDDGIYSMFDRGFTGHQHLDEFVLINMNGRLYDPVLARFLSPDPFIQSPDNLQNHNRYSYALNNPLRYTDPSGEWIHLAIGAFIGGIINWATHGAQFNAAGLGYFGVGALAGALAAGIGAGVGAALAGEAASGGGFAAGFIGTSTISSFGFLAGAVSGGAAGLTNGLISGAGNGILAGQNFKDAFLKGALDQAWKQDLGGVAFGGIMGTLDAVHNGWIYRTKLTPNESDKNCRQSETVFVKKA